MPKYRIGANLAELVYRRDDGSEDVVQSLSDVPRDGIAIDPDTGDDLDLAYVEVDTDAPGAEEIVPEGEHRWDNALPRAIHEAMSDRTPAYDGEELEIAGALSWLEDNESSDQMWTLLNRLFDDIQAIAKSGNEGISGLQ